MTHNTERWNANLHYYRVIFNAVPTECRRALDVGCGQGALTRRLRGIIPEVVGIDADRESIERARNHPEAGDVAYVHRDFLVSPFPSQSFHLITAVASLHHMDAAAAIERMRELLQPGGTLAVIGLARGSSPTDVALNAPAFIGAYAHRVTAGRSVDSGTCSYQSPILWPPPMTYQHMRRLAEQLLPGVRYQRHLYWRYSLTWSKPI